MSKMSKMSKIERDELRLVKEKEELDEYFAEVGTTVMKALGDYCGSQPAERTAADTDAPKGSFVGCDADGINVYGAMDMCEAVFYDFCHQVCEGRFQKNKWLKQQIFAQFMWATHYATKRE